jgi:hypothetical protein
MGRPHGHNYNRRRLVTNSLKELNVNDGDPVAATNMEDALTAGTLVFGDGATQVFTTDGRTTYTERGRPSQGEWRVVGDGQFESFWPPAYRATYELAWVVKDGAITGLTFIDGGRDDRFEGHYQ